MLGGTTAFNAQKRSTRNVALEMSKSNDRAHNERNLEDMMDNDWRQFRAELVARENVEQEERRQNPRVWTVDPYMASPLASPSPYPGHMHEDEGLEEQDKFGDMLSRSIAGIFRNYNDDPPRNHVENIPDQNHRNMMYTSGPRPISSRDIFEGSNIGIPEDLQTEDPFVSPAEIPSYLKPKAKIDKHRWAHPLTHLETGCILLANERLGGIFHQTVVLIVEHHETAGVIGMVINRPMEGNLQKVASGKDSSLDVSLKTAFPESTVSYGGPVLTSEFSLLHGFGEVEGSKKVCPGVFVGGSTELMNEVRINRFDQDDALFLKGHAAWVPGQLDREINKGVWYPCAASSDLILRYAGGKMTDQDNPHDLWADILTCMGGKYASISERFSGRGDCRVMP